MPVLKSFHNSGLWHADVALLEANVRRMRKDGRSLGTRTELTTERNDDALSSPDDGWGHYHPTLVIDGHAMLADCGIEWDQDIWKAVDRYTLQLTDFRATTPNDVKLQPSTGVFVHLEHHETKRDVLLGAGHLSLDNTADRAVSWVTETATLNQHFRDVEAKHPGWEIVWQGDCNRDQRVAANRALVRRHLLAGTKMHNCWEGHIPATGGTHGRRSILDLTVSTMPGGSRLLSDDASSDHRPYESWMTL